MQARDQHGPPDEPEEPPNRDDARHHRAGDDDATFHGAALFTQAMPGLHCISADLRRVCRVFRARHFVNIRAATHTKRTTARNFLHRVDERTFFASFSSAPSGEAGALVPGVGRAGRHAIARPLTGYLQTATVRRERVRASSYQREQQPWSGLGLVPL